MSVVSKTMLAEVLNVKKVTERHIMKIVRVTLNAKIKAARASSRTVLEFDVSQARSDFRDAIRNRTRGDASEQSMKGSDLEATLRGLRSNAAANLDATIEEMRDNANAALTELLDRFDAGEFNTSQVNRVVEKTVEETVEEGAE